MTNTNKIYEVLLERSCVKWYTNELYNMKDKREASVVAYTDEGSYFHIGSRECNQITTISVQSWLAIIIILQGVKCMGFSIWALTIGIEYMKLAYLIYNL